MAAMPAIINDVRITPIFGLFSEFKINHHFFKGCYPIIIFRQDEFRHEPNIPVSAPSPETNIPIGAKPIAYALSRYR